MKIIIFFLCTILLNIPLYCDTLKEVSLEAMIEEMAISTLDVRENLKLMILTSDLIRLGDEKSILQQSLEKLISDKMIIEYAKHNNIVVSEEEVKYSFQNFIQNFGLSYPQFANFAKEKKINEAILKEKIKSVLIFNKILGEYKENTVTTPEIIEYIKSKNNQKKTASEFYTITNISIPIKNKNMDEAIEMIGQIFELVENAQNTESIKHKISEYCDLNDDNINTIGNISENEISPHFKSMTKEGFAKKAVIIYGNPEYLSLMYIESKQTTQQQQFSDSNNTISEESARRHILQDKKNNAETKIMRKVKMANSIMLAKRHSN